jgi:flagellar protein FliO/FliZ
LAAGLLIQIPTISAQEDGASAEDPLRAAELAFTFGEDIPAAGITANPSVWPIIRMILVLALAAAAIYGVVFMLKKAAKPVSSTNPFLKVLANTHLSANRYAHIVSVGNKAWLVGSSEGGVNLIGEIEDKEIIDAMLLEDSRKSILAPGRFPDFMSLLRRFGVQAQTQTPSADDIRKRRERLKEI